MKTLFAFTTGLFGGAIWLSFTLAWLANENGKFEQYIDSVLLS